jgi:hypothetical protein
MRNAKAEFIELVKGLEVLCVSILNGDMYDQQNSDKRLLKLDYDKADYRTFLESLDFEYDDGYGGQELFGTVWFKDGTWADRGEYDGSEWWDHQCIPSIPLELASN